MADIRLNDGTIIVGGVSGVAITIQEEGVSLTEAATILNFVGDGVTATGTDGTKTITIPGGGGGSAITIQDEGSALATAAETINFVGAGVAATGDGATKTVTIDGGITAAEAITAVEGEATLDLSGDVTVAGDLDVEGTLQVNLVTATDLSSSLTAGSAGSSFATARAVGNGDASLLFSVANGNSINAIVVEDDEELYVTLSTDAIAEDDIITVSSYRVTDVTVGAAFGQVTISDPLTGGVAQPGQIETFQFFAAREVSADTITFVDDVEFLGDTSGVTAPADHYAFYTSGTIEFEETTNGDTINYHADVAQVKPDIAIGRADLSLANTSGYVTISGFTTDEVTNITAADSSTTTGRKYFGIHGVESLGFAVLTVADNQTNDGTSTGTANATGTITFHTFYRATNEGHESVEPDGGAPLTPATFGFGNRFQLAEFESVARIDALQEAIDDLNDNPLRYAIAITKPPGSLISWEASAATDAVTFLGTIDAFRRIEVSTTGTEVGSLFPQVTFDLITAGDESYTDWITADSGTLARYIFLQGLTEFPVEIVARINTTASDAATTAGIADSSLPNGTTRVVADIENIRSLGQLDGIATNSNVSYAGITTLTDVVFNVSEITDVRERVIDQTYTPTSEHAQSGTAVAEAITEHVGIIEIAGSDNTFESTENYTFANNNNEFTFDFTTPDSATFSVDFTVETGFIGSFSGTAQAFGASEWTLGYRATSAAAGSAATEIGTVTQGTHTGNFTGTFTLTEAVTSIAQNTEYTFVLTPGVTGIVIGTAPEGYSIRVHESYAGATQVRPGTREAIDDIADDRINRIRTSSSQLTFPDGSTFTGGGGGGTAANPGIWTGSNTNPFALPAGNSGGLANEILSLTEEVSEGGIGSFVTGATGVTLSAGFYLIDVRTNLELNGASGNNRTWISSGIQLGTADAIYDGYTGYLRNRVQDDGASGIFSRVIEITSDTLVTPRWRTLAENQTENSNYQIDTGGLRMTITAIANISGGSGDTFDPTTLTGDVSVTGTTVTVLDDSHNHIIDNVDGLQTALDSKPTVSIPTTPASTTEYNLQVTDAGVATFVEDTGGGGGGSNDGVVTGGSVSGTTLTLTRSESLDDIVITGLPSGGGGGGTGNVSNSGTPEDGELAVWTNANTIEGQTLEELGLETEAQINDSVNDRIEHLTIEALANVEEEDFTGITTEDFALRDTDTAFLNTRGSCNIYLSGDVRTSIMIGERLYPIIGGNVSRDLYTVVDRVALDGANTEVFGVGTSQAFINLVVAANRGGNPFTGFYFLPDTITGWHEESSVTTEGRLIVRDADSQTWRTVNDLPSGTSVGGVEINPVGFEGRFLAEAYAEADELVSTTSSAASASPMGQSIIAFNSGDGFQFTIGQHLRFSSHNTIYEITVSENNNATIISVDGDGTSGLTQDIGEDEDVFLVNVVDPPQNSNWSISGGNVVIGILDTTSGWTTDPTSVANSDGSYKIAVASVVPALFTDTDLQPLTFSIRGNSSGVGSTGPAGTNGDTIAVTTLTDTDTSYSVRFAITDADGNVTNTDTPNLVANAVSAVQSASRIDLTGPLSVSGNSDVTITADELLYRQITLTGTFVAEVDAANGTAVPGDINIHRNFDSNEYIINIQEAVAPGTTVTKRLYNYTSSSDTVGTLIYTHTAVQ